MLEIKSKSFPFLSGFFGLERENMRVDENGFLSQKKHPFGPIQFVDRDFCENQLEIITPVCYTIDDVHLILSEIHKEIEATLLKMPEGKEYIWPFSNPPYIENQKKIPIARYSGADEGKTKYREYLALKYGRRKMAFSGIHYNYSFDEKLLKELWMDGKQEVSFSEYKNQIYLDLAAGLMRYSWLIVFLTAASPVYDESVEWDGAYGKDRFDHYGSRRNGELGYWNYFIPFLNYNSIEEYVDSIQELIDKGLIMSGSELYLPIRLKPKGKNTIENLRENGVDHIELRMLDLNPLSSAGIFKEDLYFIHYLLMYVASREHRPFSERDQTNAVVNHKRAARYQMEEIFILYRRNAYNVKYAILHILEDMEAFYRQFDYDAVIPYIEYQRKKLYDNESRYAVQVFKKFHKHYVEKGLQMVKNNIEKEERI